MSRPTGCVNLASDSPARTHCWHIYNAIRGAQAGRCPEHGDRLVKRLFLLAVAVVLFVPVLAQARELRPGFGAWQAVPSLASEGIPGATVRSDSGRTPADRKARFEQWCKDNPEKCREMRA